MFKSLRWRLQVWHAVVLLTVLSSFVAIVNRLHWQTRLQQVDAELHRTINLVYSQVRRLVPVPMRRPRRSERTAENDPNANPANRQNQAASPANATPGSSDNSAAVEDKSAASAVEKPNSPPTEKLTTTEKSTTTEGEAAKNEGETAKAATRPPEPPFRMFRDPTPLPQEFEQLFHGDEDSRLYFLIWGKNGELLQKSELAPSIPYPNLHVKADGVPIRQPRDRQDNKHTCREVVASFALPRMPGDYSPTCDMNILVGRSLEKDLAAQQQSSLLLVITGLVILAAGVLGGGWVSSRAIRPIGDMTAAAEAISAQNLSQRINVQETDSELGKLAKVLNGTFDRLQAAFERQRQFTADASHELRTPLSVISTHTELALARSRTSEEYRGALEVCQRASRRMRSLIDALLMLARFETGATLHKHDRVDLAPIVRDCVELVEPLATDRGITIHCEANSCFVLGDENRLAQVVTNLLTNAIRYNVQHGRIDASTRSDGGMAIMSVRDTGVGIASHELPRIFDRFYQVDKVRGEAEGSCGLGLSICKTIVESHGGMISATSQPGIGTRMEVRIPLAKAEPMFDGATSSGELLVPSWEVTSDARL